eukprot:137693_1
MNEFIPQIFGFVFCHKYAVPRCVIRSGNDDDLLAFCRIYDAERNDKKSAMQCDRIMNHLPFNWMKCMGRRMPNWNRERERDRGDEVVYDKIGREEGGQQKQNEQSLRKGRDNRQPKMMQHVFRQIE